MKTTLTALLAGASLCFAYAQELKKDYENIKYFRPATYHKPFNRHYNVIYSEKRTELDGSVSEVKDKYTQHGIIQANQPREAVYHQWFWGIQKTTLLSLELTENDTLSKLYVNTGQITLLNTEPFSEQKKDANGKVVGVVWFVKVSVKVPCDVEFKDENGNVIYSKSLGNVIRTYNYPENYSKLSGISLGSKETAIASFNTERKGYLQYVRDVYISNVASIAKSEIHHTINDDDDLLTFDISYIKGKGKMKDAFEDVNSLTERLKTLCSLMKANFKAENKLNWHTEEIQNEFNQIETEYRSILQKDQEIEESGGENRFDEIARLGLIKNLLWCKVLTGKFDEAVEEATQLDGQKLSKEPSFKEAFKIFWNNLLDFAKIYKNVYASNKDAYNWI